MPSRSRTHHQGRPRAATVTGDRGRLAGNEETVAPDRVKNAPLPPRSPRPKYREPEHEFLFSKARKKGNRKQQLRTPNDELLWKARRRCGEWESLGLTREAGREAYQEHI